MSALSCELAYALQNHPNAPKNDKFNLEEMDIGELMNISERLDKEDNDNEEENLETRFDAAICSNLFIGQGIVNDRHRIAQVLGLLLRLIRTDGVVIIRENLKQWGSRSIADLTKFLDYTEDNVASYEWIFGTDFISPGGVNENRRVLKYFRHLRPGQQMLDIGVGIGGGARQAAREFGLQVLGCDLSSNMIQHAFDRNQRDKDHRVEYQIADAMVYRYEANAFDIVFSRDCIQHIKDTKRLFRNIYTWLKPGGQVLVTMYGKGHGVLSPKFHEYVRKRQYALKTLEEYREIAHNVGLTNIYTENMTKRLREILVIERDRAVENKEEFIQKFSEKLYSKLIEGWADKLQFIDEDNQNWLLLRAEKPVHPHAYLTEAGA
uniref:phosphoethanolamine N-methyltransferase n=1 Tax=Meloidogyne javanica TaxID=6303 RepID=A0A915LCW5_MELJA